MSDILLYQRSFGYCYRLKIIIEYTFTWSPLEPNISQKSVNGRHASKDWPYSCPPPPKKNLFNRKQPKWLEVKKPKSFI